MLNISKPDPKTMFLIDGLGALLSTLMLGAVLPMINPLIGMPDSILYFLALVAFVFFAFSLSCYQWIPLTSSIWLRLIAFLNSAYCLLTAILIVVYWNQMKPLGILYFLAEIGVIFGIVSLEHRVIRQNYPEPMSTNQKK